MPPVPDNDLGVVLFLQVFCAGFLVAAPLGPVAFFVLRCVLQNHFGLALLAGAGAAAADAFLGFSALIGLRWVHFFFTQHQTLCRLSGGLFLSFLGLALLIYPPHPKASRFSPHPFWAFGTGFVITLLNPLTLTAFVATFSIFNLQIESASLRTTLALTLALFGGGCAWWAGLTALAKGGRRWLGVAQVHLINRIISVLLLMAGVGTLVHLTLLKGLFQG
jgi:threonine/homoserine/homoserine lactone efflux protein